MEDKAKTFLISWVRRNVHGIPLSLGLNVDEHVRELVRDCVKDAARNDISEAELDECAGDLEDFMLNEFEQVHDPDAGGIRD